MTEYIMPSIAMPALDLARIAASADDGDALRGLKEESDKEPQVVVRPRKRGSSKLRLARLNRLDSDTKAKVSRSVQTSHVRSWLHGRGYVVKADKLHPAITRVIAQWFDLVDDDGSHTLEHRELLAALKTAHIPCDDATITEMIGLMDINQDGVIGWDEFEVFMAQEFAAGKNLLSGEYLLPSGLSINFGVMIGKLKRDKLLSDVMEEGVRRARWADIARDSGALGRELAVMQEAAEATHLTLEHINRNEAGDSGVATPRTQLTEALLREMEHDRRLARDKAFSGASYADPASEHQAARASPDDHWGQDARQRRSTMLGVSPDPCAPGPVAAEGALAPRASALAERLALMAKAGNDAAAGGAGGGSRSSSPGGGLASATLGTFSRCGTPIPPMLEAPPPPGLAVRPPERRVAKGSGALAGAAPSRSASRQGAHEELAEGGGGGGGGGHAASLGHQPPPPTAGHAAPGASKGAAGTGAGTVAEWRRRTSLQCGSPASFDEMMTNGGGRAAAYRLLTASQGGDGGAQPRPERMPYSADPAVHAATAAAAATQPLAWRNHRHRVQRTMSTVGQIAEDMRAAAAADASAADLATGSLPPPQPHPRSQPHLRATRQALYPTRGAATVDGLVGGSPLASPAGSFSGALQPAAPSHSQPGSYHGGAGATNAVGAKANATAALPYAPAPVPYFVAPSYSGLMLPILTDPDQLADFLTGAVAVSRARAAAAGTSRSASPAPPGGDTSSNYYDAGPPRYGSPGPGSSCCDLAHRAGPSSHRAVIPMGHLYDELSHPAHHLRHLRDGSPGHQHAAPAPAPAPAVHPSARDAAALLSERKTIVRAASRRPSVGGTSTASSGAHGPSWVLGPAPVLGADAGLGSEYAFAPDADTQEWISYSRIPASTLGPTPVAAPHAHARSLAGSPAPPQLPRDRGGGGGPPSGPSCATELGPTAAVIAHAQAQAAAAASGYGGPLGGGGPNTLSSACSFSSGRASALRPSSSLARTRSALLSRDGLCAPPSPHTAHPSAVASPSSQANSPGANIIWPALKGPQPAQPPDGLGGSHSTPGAPSRGSVGGVQAAQGSACQSNHTCDVEDADAEVARLLGDAPASSRHAGTDPDPRKRPEPMLQGPRWEPLGELGVRSESAPPGKAPRTAAPADKRTAGGGGGGGAGMRSATSSIDGAHGGGGGGPAARSVRVSALGLCVQGVAPNAAGSTSGSTASSLAVSAWSPASPGPPLGLALSTEGGLGTRPGSWSSSGLGPGASLYSSAPPSMADADSCTSEEVGSMADRAAHEQRQRLTGGAMRRSDSSSAQGGGSSSGRPGSRLGVAGGQRGASPARAGPAPSRSRSQLSWRHDKEDPLHLTGRAANVSLLQVQRARRVGAMMPT